MKGRGDDMSVSKDGKMWRCQFYYKDWQGNRKKKNKRGFRTKSEAEQWERDFRQKHSGNISIRFDNFVETYIIRRNNVLLNVLQIWI